MFALLHNMGDRNHRKAGSMTKFLEDASFPSPNKKALAVWPPFKGPLGADSRNLGKQIFSFLTVSMDSLLHGILGIEPFQFGKYNGNGPHYKESMILQGVPTRFAESFAKAANGSKSHRTWKQRRSVMNLISKCGVEIAHEFIFPWSDYDLQNFVGWCLVNGKKASTIEQYVSNIRSIHLDMNLVMEELNWKLLKDVIKGHANLSDPSPSRIPMTPELLFFLKTKLSKSAYCVADRRLIWVLCTAMFMGCFRVGELLSPTIKRFCPDTTLLGKDISWEKVKVGNSSVEMLKFKIKCPKETRGSSVVEVEIFDMGTCFYDCVSAWKKWRQSSSLPLSDDLPVFRRENGNLFTPNHLNSVLKDLLKDRVIYTEGVVATHCFRGGLVSCMARLGYNKEDIQRQGRWSSDSYKSYLKLGRSTRIEEQWALSNKIANLVGLNGSLNRL